MELIVGKTYKLSFDAGLKILTFTGEIIDLSSEFISFEDKFKTLYSFARKRLISVEDLSC